MSKEREPRTRSVLLADRHHGLCEGVRVLLSSMFEVVVMVADEASVEPAVRAAGADAFVLKRAIATDLLPAAEAVLAGPPFS